MKKYLLVAGALFLGLSASFVLGMGTLGAVFVPIPVAIYFARGDIGRSLGLVAAVGLSALVTLDSLTGILYYCSMALVGIPLGLGMTGRWSYTRSVLVMSAVSFGASLIAILLMWPEWLESCRQTLGLLMDNVNQQADADKVEAVVNSLTWLQVHWPEIGVGLVFWVVLIQMAVTLSLAQNWFRRRVVLPPVQEWFANYRQSDWLVWGVIAVALLWFAERTWPELISRVFVWNAAICLSALYWLSGLAILIYAVEAFRPHLFVFVCMMMLLVMSLWVHPMLCVIGLFDTWGSFRQTVDRMVAARKKRLEDIDRTDDTE